MKEFVHGVTLPPINISLIENQEPVEVTYTTNGGDVLKNVSLLRVEYDYEFSSIMYDLVSSIGNGSVEITREYVDAEYAKWRNNQSAVVGDEL